LQKILLVGQGYVCENINHLKPDKEDKPWYVHASLFSQLIALFNHSRFYELVYRHQAERCIEWFSCWDQFVSMLFCHISQAKSLREISGGLASAQGKLLHLRVKSAPKKSTLSYANAHRPWQLSQDLFFYALREILLSSTG
jgi:hypothetical protein